MNSTIKNSSNKIFTATFDAGTKCATTLFTDIQSCSLSTTFSAATARRPKTSDPRESTMRFFCLGNQEISIQGGHCFDMTDPCYILSEDRINHTHAPIIIVNPRKQSIKYRGIVKWHYPWKGILRQALACGRTPSENWCIEVSGPCCSSVCKLATHLQVN